MKKILLLLLIVTDLSAQTQFSISPIVGYTRLTHNIDFRTTEMYNLYKFVEISHQPQDYSWAEFEDDYDLKNYVYMPRFGVSADLYAINLIKINAQLLSSSSTYTKFSYSIAIGMGRHLKLSEDNKWTLPFYLGYRLLYDSGFGYSTLVNSIGNQDAKRDAETFFGPQDPLGDPHGRLFYMTGGLSHTTNRIRMNLYFQQEIDLTDGLQRQSRMNTFGVFLSMEYFLKK